MTHQTAIRVSVTDAKRHYLAGARIVVSDTEHGPTNEVAEGTTVYHQGGGQEGWERLMIAVESWGRHQTFYVWHLASPADPAPPPTDRGGAVGPGGLRLLLSTDDQGSAVIVDGPRDVDPWFLNDAGNAIAHARVTGSVGCTYGEEGHQVRAMRLYTKNAEPGFAMSTQATDYWIAEAVR